MNKVKSILRSIFSVFDPFNASSHKNKSKCVTHISKQSMPQWDNRPLKKIAKDLNLFNDS